MTGATASAKRGLLIDHFIKYTRAGLGGVRNSRRLLFKSSASESVRDTLGNAVSRCTALGCLLPKDKCPPISHCYTFACAARASGGSLLGPLTHPYDLVQYR